MNVLALSTYRSFSVQSLDLEVRLILITEVLSDHANAHIQTTRDVDIDLVCLHTNFTIENQERTQLSIRQSIRLKSVIMSAEVDELSTIQSPDNELKQDMALAYAFRPHTSAVKLCLGGAFSGLVC